jgi:hypothetical protein
MKDALHEFLLVLAHSTKTQWCLALGFISFFVILVAGLYFTSTIQLHGALAPTTDSFREFIAHKYDKAAWLTLGSFLLLAVQCYRKDRKRLLG